jgi:hypothetical protein
MGLVLPVPWSDDQQLSACLTDKSLRSNPFTRLRSLLVQLEPLVEKNLLDFQAFQLSAEYLEKMFSRQVVVVGYAAGPLQWEDTDLLIHAIAERDRELAQALSNDWDHGRFPNSAAKQEPVTDLAPKDQLVFQWQRAAADSASLASHPERFYQLLEAVQRG